MCEAGGGVSAEGVGVDGEGVGVWGEWCPGGAL